MVAGNGDRHVIWTTGLLPRRTCRSAGRAVETGCGTRIWGQARCPIYRSGTFNVKRSTLNFQWGDRKGAWWPGYGDRHDVRYTDQERSTCNVQLSTFNGLAERAHGGREWGQTRNLDNRTIAPPDLPQRRSGGRNRLRRTDMGTGTMSDIPIRNVQRETFNSQLSMG